MVTGKKPGKDAGKLLSDKKSNAKVKRVAASDLAQVPAKKKKRP